jgi:hypothetical protein
MPRIPTAEMEKREEALQEVMEQNLDGLTVSQLVDALKQKSVPLPKNEYQAVYVVLKRAEKAKIVECKEGKWRLLEDEEPAA